MLNTSHQFSCSSCQLRNSCIPSGLMPHENDQIENMVSLHLKIEARENLYAHGDAFDSLYAVRRGVFKITMMDATDQEQVIDFKMPGELLGLDGIFNDVHTCNATALEDSEICIIPYDKIEKASREVKIYQRHLHKVLSQGYAPHQHAIHAHGPLRADARLAAFLLNLSQRFHARGFSASHFVLRMKRSEIASYLGLKIETVSRSFAKLVERQLIDISYRHVRILDMPSLQALVNHEATP